MPYEIILIVLIAFEGLCISVGVAQIHKATHQIEKGYCSKREVIGIIDGFLTILIGSIFITIFSIVFWN